MRQRKMKQRKSKQSKSLAKILTLGIAAATVVSSMSAPGGLLAPETVYADDNTGTAESGDQGTEPQEEPIQFDVIIGPNDSATVYVMQVTSLADTDMMSYQYSINGTDYYPLQRLQTQESFGANQTVDLHVREVGSGDTILAAGKCALAPVDQRRFEFVGFHNSGGHGLFKAVRILRKVFKPLTVSVQFERYGYSTFTCHSL